MGPTARPLPDNCDHGTQGVQINPVTPGVPGKPKKKFYDFYSKKESDIPAGYYVDLTALLAQFKFERIPAHKDWKTNAKGQEWWHFHYVQDLQPTFLDEMELRGVSEKVLRGSSWTTEKELDHKPG